MGQAVGIVELFGLVAAFAAADAGWRKWPSGSGSGRWSAASAGDSAAHRRRQRVPPESGSGSCPGRT